MITIPNPPATQTFHVGTYNSGQPYVPARGRYAPREQVQDRLASSQAVFDLSRQRPTAAEFLRMIVREMQARYYQPSTVQTYRNALARFLRWFGGPPHRLTREHVRSYLELLVRGGGGHSWVGQNVLAIRTAFDRLCGGTITLGLDTPRKPRRLPKILSTQAVVRLLEAAPSLRDKLLLGLLYGTGMRASEVVRLRWRDIDFDRSGVTVWEGMGRGERQVMLPANFAPLLREQAKLFGPEDYVFPGSRPGTHLSARSAARALERASKIAGLQQPVSTRTLRHCFAVHLLENGTDVRYVQVLLGHVKLETTTVYLKIADRCRKPVSSPLDVLTGQTGTCLSPQQIVLPPPPARAAKPVGRMQIHLQPRPGETAADVRLVILGEGPAVTLGGIVAREVRPGWANLEIPPLEHWADAFRWLTPPQRQRIESAEFFAMLKAEVGRRYQALQQGSG